MPEIQIPNIIINLLQLFLAFIGAFLLALWISLIIWTFRDSRSRSRDVFAILLSTLMVAIFGPFGLIIYFLLRPPVTLAELYERSLEEEALLQDLDEQHRCAGCSRMVEEDWIVCPDCHTQLKKVCIQCGQKLHLRWKLCPYCSSQQPTLSRGANSHAHFQPQAAQQTQPYTTQETHTQTRPISTKTEMGEGKADDTVFS